jgi:outer membrane murein-binding lipoprotein Lpp
VECCSAQNKRLYESQAREHQLSNQVSELAAALEKSSEDSNAWVENIELLESETSFLRARVEELETSEKSASVMVSKLQLRVEVSSQKKK